MGKSSHLCCYFHHHHHHHHVPERLGVFPVPWSSRWSWSLHLFLGRPMFLRTVGLYCSACFGSLFVSILHPLFLVLFYFFYYVLCSFFCLILWFFSLSCFVIPSNCLKNLICAVFKRCSSLFFSTQASLPNFNNALAVILWILNFVSLFSFVFQNFSVELRLFCYNVCNLYSKSLPYSDMRFSKYLKSATFSIIL